MAAVPGSEVPKAKIVVLEGRNAGDEIEVGFNPGQYSVDKQMNYGEQSVAGLTTPLTQFVDGGAETLSMDLFFDVTEGPTADVREHTEQLDALLEIDGELHAPPTCRFVWGTLEFKAVLESANKQFTMFARNGTPLRATVTVQFKRYRTPEEQSKSRPKQSADRTTVRQVEPGDTLWGIADAEYGDPARWRPIADENDIDNPRELTPGTELVVPKLESGEA